MSRTPEAPLKSAVVGADVAEENSEFRFSVSSAINGKVITIGKFKRNPHGPDWTHQLYIVPEGGDLIDALRVCVTLNHLRK